MSGRIYNSFSEIEVSLILGGRNEIMKKVTLFACVLTFPIVFHVALGDLSHMFTALAHMSRLVELEGDLLTELEGYITAEERRLAELKSFARNVRNVQNVARDDPRGHILHPTNAMALILRYYNWWSRKIGEMPDKPNAKSLLAMLENNKNRIPKEEDFSGAVVALTRLQDTYLITPRNLTQSHLGGKQSVSLSALDCFEIGRESYLKENWWYTKEWMLEALRKYDEGDTEGLDLADVFDHLSFVEYRMGNIRRAKQFARDLLQNDPDHERGQRNLAYFENEIKENAAAYVATEPAPRSRKIEHEMERYEELCRQGDPIPPEHHRKLLCFYYTNQRHPLLILKPAKIEVVYVKPRIFLLRDLIFDSDIARLQELGGPKLNRATVFDGNGKMVFSTIRTSKSAWLEEWEDSTGRLTRINSRISAITSLDMSTAELLQVCNYGIGGHYDPHYDFSTRPGDMIDGNGRRIATVLMYLTNVTLGGATVFTEAGARLTPSKGDAAFWWNLKRSGEGDLTTRHAACPVLVGSKWVCNKWIHERGQEFRRKCSLSPKK